MIQQLSVFLENKPGRLAELTERLGEGGHNMRLLTVADTAEYGVARILCDRPRAAKEMLQERGFGVSLTRVVAVEVPDRPGGLAEVLRVLGDADLNVEYAYCFVPPSGETAVYIGRTDEPDRANEVMGEAGMSVLGAASLYALDAD
jgi:hypothetical protein